MLTEGARRLAAGERPRMTDLLLTPGNVRKLADRLSHLRGAAMKLGQMLSMDAGDLLPDELTTVLARLRDNAHHMPPQQLQRVLAKQWGSDWRKRFTRLGGRHLLCRNRDGCSVLRRDEGDRRWRRQQRGPCCHVPLSRGRVGP
jgi:hypothetical protein